MSRTKPVYEDLGLAKSMGPKLKTEVERQLTVDLRNYHIYKTNLRFDWSESCIEGHHTEFLDGIVENFSGILVFDDTNNLVAEGWMEFIHENDFFLVYWEFVVTWDEKGALGGKKEAGLSKHIFEILPEELKLSFTKIKMKEI